MAWTAGDRNTYRPLTAINLKRRSTTAMRRVNHYDPSHHSFSESLHQNLNQAHALVLVALQGGFFSCDPSTMHDYLSVLEDLILRSKNTLDAHLTR